MAMMQGQSPEMMGGMDPSMQAGNPLEMGGMPADPMAEFGSLDPNGPMAALIQAILELKRGDQDLLNSKQDALLNELLTMFGIDNGAALGGFAEGAQLRLPDDQMGGPAMGGMGAGY